MTTLGVLLAGGRGARLGPGSPKALVTVAGKTLLERALETLGPVCDVVVIAAPAALTLEPALGRARMDGRVELRRVDDPADAAGPLAGLVAGLEAARFRRALALGVDFPLMRVAFLAALLDRLEDGPGSAISADAHERARAVIPAPAGVPQPLVAAYAPEATAVLRAALDRGERAATRAVLALAPRLLGDDELAALPGGLESLFNLNTPDALAEAERRLASPRETA